MTVASAAPFMPQCIPKINTGSKIIFMTAPSNMDSIEIDGLSSARITAFIILNSIYTGKNARIILKYSTAIPMLLSDAPNKVKSRTLSGKKIAISTRLEKSVITMPVPIDL